MLPLTTTPTWSPTRNVFWSTPCWLVHCLSSATRAPDSSSTHTLSGVGVTLPTPSLLPVWQSARLPVPLSPFQHATEPSLIS